MPHWPLCATANSNAAVASLRTARKAAATAPPRVANSQSSATFRAITPHLQQSVSPSLDEFRKLASLGNLIPIIVDLVADVETPVSAFAKIADSGPCFLFESAERNEELGRFSFIGFDPLAIFNSADFGGDPLI